MDQAMTSVSSPCNGDETGLEQLSSDLQALKRLYGLLHKGPANENLDETSRALLMKMLDDATQQTLLKQAKILSGSLMSPALERKLSIRSDRQTRDAEPPMSLRPPALPSTPSLLAGERPSRLNPQYSTVSSRAVGNVHGSPLATEEPVLARLASYRSSRTTASALPPRHRPSGEQWNSGLSLYRLPVAAMSRHGTVTGGARNADHRDTTRRTSGRGDQTSLETSSSRGSERARPGVAATLRHGTVAGDTTRRTSGRGDQSSPEGSISSHSRRSMSPEVSLGRTGLRDRGTVRHVGAEGFSSVRRLRRLDSGLSQGMVSCRGSERAGRGVAATSQHGTVIGSNRQAEQRDRTRRTSGRGDQSSPKGSSRRRFVSREMSLGRKRLQGRGTDRRVGAESSSTRRLGRLDSRLSLGMVSRCGSERAGRGVAATSQHGTVIGRNRHADQRDRTRRTSGRGHQSSTEGSSRRRSVSRGASLGQAQLHGSATVQHVGAESSSSMRPLRRQDSGLTLGKASCCGSERAGRGVATPEQSSSSNTMVTIHSRIRPNRDPKGRRLRRAEDDDEESTPWRRSTNASASSAGLSRRKPRRTLKRADSGSMYISSHNSLSGAAISYHSTSPTVLPESSASASYSPPPVSRPGTVPPVSWQGIALPMPWRGIAPPMYAPQVSRSMRRRRRQEVLAKRVERLRMLKNKIATVFHHHYHYGRDQEGPSSSRTPGEQHHMSPLKYLEGMFHRTKGQDKKSTSRAVVSAPGKRPGGNMQALFDEMRSHLRAKRRAPTSVNLWRKIANRSRVHAKKMHWWQRLKPRRGRAGVLAGSKLRRRLGR